MSWQRFVLPLVLIFAAGSGIAQTQLHYISTFELGFSSQAPGNGPIAKGTLFYADDQGVAFAAVGYRGSSTTLINRADKVGHNPMSSSVVDPTASRAAFSEDGSL